VSLLAGSASGDRLKLDADLEAALPVEVTMALDSGLNLAHDRLLELDRQIAAGVASPDNWQVSAMACGDAIDGFATQALSILDRVAEAGAKERGRKLILDWRKRYSRFVHTKVITAGHAAVDLLAELREQESDLSTAAKTNGWLNDGYRKQALELETDIRWLESEVARVRTTEPALKRLAVKQEALRKARNAERRARALSRAIRDRQTNSRKFLESYSPAQYRTRVAAFGEKAWSESLLAEFDVPQAWKDTLLRWHEAVQAADDTYIKSWRKASAGEEDLSNEKLLEKLPLFQGLGYDEIAKPAKVMVQRIETL
jgi:hypothetical protein